MRIATYIAVISLLALPGAMAGNLNVINLTENAPLELILATKTSEKTFAVERLSSSGPFKLTGSVTLRTASGKLPELKIPEDEGNHIAILFPAEGSTKWRLLASKSKVDKWSFRVINLTEAPVSFSHTGNEISIGKDEELEIKVTGKKDIGLKLLDEAPQSYPNREPCAVIAFLTKQEGKTVVTFILDL